MKATGIVRRIEEYFIRTSRRSRKQVFGGWRFFKKSFEKNSIF